MIKLNPDEKILMVIRRHWFVMVGPVVLLIILLVFPSIFLTTVPYFYPALNNSPEIQPMINFSLALYILTVILYLFIWWSDYYLDIWIITNKRLVDIEQKGLFNRHISEMNVENIQNVTLQIEGLIPTLLKFGNLLVETAGEGQFKIKDAPNLYEAKDLLLRFSNHHTNQQPTTNNPQPTTAPATNDIHNAGAIRGHPSHHPNQDSPHTTHPYPTTHYHQPTPNQN